MRVLISGIAGFIGSNLARNLVETVEVCGIDDFSTGHPENLSDLKVDFIEGSILDDRALSRAVRGCDAVVHLAARPSVPRSLKNPGLTHDVNSTGTLRVLEAARACDISHVVVASSSSVYGANAQMPKVESMTPMPMSPYAVSKLTGEQYALAWQHSYQMKTLAFRFFNVYGPRQDPDHDYAAVVPKFIWSALRGRALEIHGDGAQSRDFTFVDSVCGVIKESLVRRVSSPTPVNLAFGSRITLLELVEELEGILGRPLERSFGSTRTGDVKHSQADPSLLLQMFPDLKPTSLREGLRSTVEWLISHSAGV